MLTEAKSDFVLLMMDVLYHVYVELFVLRPPDGSHYTRKTTKPRPYGFRRFMKKHKKINDILKYEYNLKEITFFLSK